MSKKEKKVYTKICTKCNHEKWLEEFYKKAASKDGYFPRCKVCQDRATVEGKMKKSNVGRRKRLSKIDKETFDWSHNRKELQEASDKFVKLFWNTNEAYVSVNDWLAVFGIELKAIRQELKELKK